MILTGVQESSNYVCDLVKPVLTCFFDSDSRVRYYACESLYNIVKVTRGSVLLFFNDIFDGLSKVRIHTVVCSALFQLDSFIHFVFILQGF